MKAIFQKIAESEFVFWIAVVLAVLGFLYLRNGAEYFSGDSGGAYWDNMTYCKSHPNGQMKIYSKLARIFHDGQSERRIPGRNEMDWRRASIRVRKEAIFQVADRISPYPVVCHRAGSSTWCRLRRQGASSSQEDLAQRVI